MSAMSAMALCASDCHHCAHTISHFISVKKIKIKCLYIEVITKTSQQTVPHSLLLIIVRFLSLFRFGN